MAKEIVKKNVCVLFGGVSPEHEISLRSAEMVLRNIDRDLYNVYPVGIRRDGRWLLHGGECWELTEGIWDVNPSNSAAFISPERGRGLGIFTKDRVRWVRLDCVFPVLHGENGEDGSVQGLLQLAGIPFVGCGVRASAAAMDKALTKLAAAEAGVRQARCLVVSPHKADIREKCERAGRELGFPLFVKPAGTGSSVGVSKARNMDELLAGVADAFKYDNKVLLEEFIDGRELEVAILGNGEPVASPVGEIVSGAEFYDYDAKYINDTAKTFIPDDIPQKTLDEIRAVAIKVYRALGCRGLSRADFFLDRAGEPVFNEINTIPGFTSISMYPKLFAAAGIPETELITRLIELAGKHG